MSNVLKGSISAEGTVTGNLATVFGVDGKSAYQVAVDNGFKGTEAEWLESLKAAVKLGSLTPDYFDRTYLEWQNRTTVNTFADLDNIIATDTNLNTAFTVMFSGLSPIKSVVGDGTFFVLKSNTSESLLLTNVDNGEMWSYTQGANEVTRASVTKEDLENLDIDNSDSDSSDKWRYYKVDVYTLDDLDMTINHLTGSTVADAHQVMLRFHVPYGSELADRVQEGVCIGIVDIEHIDATPVLRFINLTTGVIWRYRAIYDRAFENISGSAEITDDVTNAGVFSTIENLRAYEFKENCLYKIYTPSNSSLTTLLGGSYGVYWLALYWVDYSDGNLKYLTLTNLENGRIGTLCVDNGSWDERYIEVNDGFSPTAKVTQTTDGATITITDKDGTTTANIVNGKDGKDGTDGKDGSSGVYVGSGEMPEDCNVQINPDGVAVTIEDITTAKLTETVESIGAKIISGEIKSIVLIGDSITDGYGGTGYNSTASTTAFSTNTAGYCWANAFKKLVEARYGVPVVNRGIWGSYANYQTEQALTVITKNDFVIWLSGTNNRMNFMDYEDNLVNYIQSIKAKSAGMLFISNIPSSGEDESTKSPYTMRSIDEAAAKSARINNVPFLSLYKEYIKYCETHSVELENTFYDMIHPNDTGYLIMFKILCEKLGVPLSPYIDYSVQGDWWSAVSTILDTGYGETGTGFEMVSGTIPIFIMSGYNPTDKTTVLSGKKVRRIEFSGEDFQAGRLLLVCGKLANIGTGTGALDGNRKCYCDIPTNGVLDFGEDGFFIPENMTLGFGQVVATLPTTAKLCYATGATSDNWCITASTWKSFTSETAPEIRLVAKIHYTD